MNLAVVSTPRLERKVGIELERRGHSYVLPPVSISDHATISWLRAMDLGFVSDAGATAPPVWLYNTFKWGAHPWPVRWRDIPDMEAIDCGLMAWLSTEIYNLRGVAAVPVQLVLNFNTVSVAGWAGLWRKSGLDPHWCVGRYAYHEVTGVVGTDGEIRFWDPLGRFWLPVRSMPGYEGIVALSARRYASAYNVLRYKGQPLIQERWYSVSDWFFGRCQTSWNWPLDAGSRDSQANC